MRRKALKQKKIWNPALFGIRNPVLGIRNPQGGIQNPVLSWIPLHGATSITSICNGQSLLRPRWWHELNPKQKPEPLTETIVFIYHGVHFIRAKLFSTTSLADNSLKVRSPSSSIFIPTFRLPATTYIFLFHVHVEYQRKFLFKKAF